jgi:multicomponent Na+:H+ antiporter subunit D
MIIGLGLFTEMAIAGAIFYLIHDIVVKTNLFMVSGLVYRITGTSSIRSLGGLYAQYPLLSLLIAIPLFSLVGIPPLSGFWPKISLVTAAFEGENWWAIGAILFASLITLVIIARVWANVVWKDKSELPERLNFRYYKNFTKEGKMQLVAPIIFLSLISLFIGFGAEHVQQLSSRVATELMDRQQYIDAVFKTSQTTTP